ncbi:MAG: D-alanine--D-alanine ligase [Anaerolineae bacterium]|nr:D-alanine--D-alanine ligase [Anaerolineae bacterium]
MPESKRRVAVLFGGQSGEHQVSLASARSIMGAMDRDKYEIVPIGITPSGRWLLKGDPMAQLSAGEEVASAETGAIMVAGERELVPGTSRARFPEVDVVFPVLHGTYGEDGTVQGLLELADLPYVGAGVLGSALGLDKVAQKAVLASHGLPIVAYEAILRSHWRRASDEIIERIEERFIYPVFVKPANLGSSVGVSKAHDRAELRRGLDLAARFDRRLLVEAGINAREIECSVLGNDDPVASVLGEVVPSNEFYDYRAKYVDDASELHIPAKLPEETARTIQQLAVQAFRAIDCAGMARADFFLCRDTGQVYVNELNTIPGFTSISMYPKLWAASGLPYPDLIDRLIELAIERHAEKHASETTYQFDH